MKQKMESRIVLRNEEDAKKVGKLLVVIGYDIRIEVISSGYCLYYKERRECDGN